MSVRCRHAGRVVALLAAALGALIAPEAAGQSVRAYVSTDSITVGDRFALSIVAEHNFMMEATFPAPPPDTARTQRGFPTAAIGLRFGDLEVIRRDTFEASYGGTAAPGLRRDSVVYEVTTFAIDSAVVGPIPVQFTAGEDTFSVATQPFVLPVVSLVPPDAQGLRPLAPLAEFPTPLWPWILLALALVVLLLTIYYWWRERQEEPGEVVAPTRVAVPPYEEARQRLRTLRETVDPSDPEQTKPFYVELADLLRTFIEARLDVPALEQTSRELTRELELQAHLGRLPETLPAHVYGVLALADLVKFADMRPPASQHAQALEETDELLDLVEEAGVYRTSATQAPALSSAS